MKQQEKSDHPKTITQKWEFGASTNECEEMAIGILLVCDIFDYFCIDRRDFISKINTSYHSLKE